MFKRRKVDDTQAAEAPGEGRTSMADSTTTAGGRAETIPDSGALAPGALPSNSGSVASLRAPDSGLGVPPFRPVQAKEAHFMGRSPFAATPAPQAPSPSSSAMRPSVPAPSAAMVAPQPQTVAGRPTPSREPAERRTLVVGRGISVQGTVQDAERLVVEGTVEASMIHATELSISPGGIFKGEVEVDDAEVAGTIDGTLTARNSLIVRTSGRVLGTARCKRLQVEDGGQITGRVEMITDASRLDSMKVATENAA